MKPRRAIALAIMVTTGTLASGVALAASGQLDPTFSGDGKVTTAVAPGADNDFVYAMAQQWDGKIVVVGTSNMGGSTGYDVSLVRYKIDGSLDAAFSKDGKVTTDFHGGYDYAEGVAIQLDGKIVVAGSTDNTAGGTAFDLVLARYNPNGTLDKSFSKDGKVTTAVSAGSKTDGATEIAVQRDGKIVVVGYSSATESDPGQAMLARYNSNGTLDKTFSSDGIAPVPGAIPISELTSIALAANGKIVIAGTVDGGATGEDMAVLRFTSRGRLDTAFGGGDGIVTLPLGSGADNAEAIALSPDGKIVIVGRRGSPTGTLDDFAVVRLLADGTPDGTFGFEGIVTTDIGASSDRALAVAIQWDGKIVVAGRSLLPDTGHDATVVRYNTDGTLDGSFAPDGIVTTAIAPSSGTDEFYGVAIQWDGKIVGAGTAEDNSASNVDFAVARIDATTTVQKATALAPSTILRRQLPTGASVKITVAAASKRVCSVVRGKLKTLEAGTCRATVTVTPRGTAAVPRPRTIRVSVSFTVVD